MASIFLGGIKNLLHGNKTSENTVQRITQNLGKSNLGAHRSNTAAGTQATVSGKDCFDIAQHISDLLSPACGMTEEEKESYYNKIMGKLKSGKKIATLFYFMMIGILVLLVLCLQS